MESRAEGAPCAPKARPGASQEAWPPRAASPKRTHLLHHDSPQLCPRAAPNAVDGPLRPRFVPPASRLEPRQSVAYS